MKTNLKIRSIFILLLFFISIEYTNGQENQYIEDVFADKYFFSHEESKKSIIVYARRDTVIEVWVDGLKDVAKYTNNFMDRSFYSDKSEVAYEFYDRRICSVAAIFDGDEFRPQINPQVFGEVTLYDCSKVNDEYWEYISPEEVLNLNNIAYYLQQLEDPKCNDCIILILEKIIKASPTRIVAYLNLGDAHWSNKNYTKAKSAYAKYCELMQAKGKKTKIPKRVSDRMKIYYIPFEIGFEK
ncbi:hypothetical protein [Ancylomarina sp. 16SWW S1-10-2]|uniref:hypothetical protein n=1 Tax=Ancylomarina sp. 16SWW S1-10-2 TaxID=2499681 RepID=UPI0012AE3AD3|nr:hypothetical protein [Ancylomarina sp. 16SWW S1-10-2]MRT92835.1 hypothetical protein [Ancylomarina sp. 16SWW S1-10-2]